MAEAAPRVPKVPEGLFFWRTTSQGRLAKALAASLVLHAALLGVSAFPRFSWSGTSAGEVGRLFGELRPAERLSGQATEPPLAQATRAPKKSRPAVAAKSPGQAVGGGKLSTRTSSADDVAPLEAASLSAYRLIVARQARQFKYYPPAASAAGISAEVLVALLCVPGSSEALVSLLQSSGNRQLDEAAVSMITQAVRLAPLPVELRGRHLRLELEVLFGPGL